MATSGKATKASSAAQAPTPTLQRRGAVVGAALPAGTAADIVEAASTPKVELSDSRASKRAGDQVTVIVPKAFTLTMDDHSSKSFEAGVQEMDRVDAEHWFSRAQGVTIYTKP